jgi:hypothetical protein
MQLKRFILTLFTTLLVYQNANAATFNYTPTDDVYYTNNGYAVNFVDDLGATEKYIPYLKFNTSNIDLTKEEGTSAKLTMFIKQSRGIDEIYSMGLYFVKNDSWSEGNLYNGTDIGDIAKYGTPAFTSATKPDFSSQDLLANGTIYNNRVEWVIPKDKLQNILNDGTLSLAIQMDAKTDFYSYFSFNSSELKGERINLLHFYQYRNSANMLITNYLETVTAVDNPNSPFLTIETAPTPEPSSMILGLMGLGSMLGLRRKK